MKFVYVIIHDWKEGVSASTAIEGVFYNKLKARDALRDIACEYYEAEKDNRTIQENGTDGEEYYSYNNGDYRQIWIETHIIEDSE